MDEQPHAEIKELCIAQMELAKKFKEAWARFEAQPVEDYTFKNEAGEDVKLSELFGENDKLLVVHNMGFACPYCTLWADHFSGTDYWYTKEGVSFVLSSPDSPEQQVEGKAKRGWTFPLVSTQGSSFAGDMGFADGGNVMPGISAFRKNANGSMVRTAFNFFGPGDPYIATFHFLDFFAAG